MANTKYFFASLLFIFISLGMIYSTMLIPVSSFTGPTYVAILIAIGFCALLILIIGVAFLFISTQRIAKHHSLFSALRLLVYKYYRLYIGFRILHGIRSSFKNPREAQERLLRDIITKNKDTVYGRQFKLREITSLEDFRDKHPVTEYGHYEEFVDRVAKGEKNIMTALPVTRLSTTTGTTGKSKLIPNDEYDVDKTFATMEAMQYELFPDVHPMQQMLKVHCNSSLRYSDGGLPITTASQLMAHMVKNQVMYTPPAAGTLIGTIREAFYIDLLFSLRDKELGSALILFTGAIVDLMHFLEVNWKDLVADLSRGTINATLNLSPEVRSSLLKSLGCGDNERAMEIKTECEKGFDGIMKRLWPKLEFISCIDPGGLRNSLKKSYAKGVELHCSMYGTTECCPLGLNFWPFDDGVPEYVLNPPRVIYEFIKVADMNEPNPKTYFIDEVEVTQRYELLISQRYGLYRFRFGDVIEVSGYHGNCPKIKVLHRKATLLNMINEKVGQDVIKDAVTDAIKRWNDKLSLIHYCIAESLLFEGNEGLHYIIFLEVKSKATDSSLPPDLKEEAISQEIQKGICKRHETYRKMCQENRIKPPKVHITKSGAFKKLQEYIITNTSASWAQFKMPVKLRKKEFVEVMLQNSLK